MEVSYKWQATGCFWVKGLLLMISDWAKRWLLHEILPIRILSQKKKKKILTCEQPWIWQMIAIYSSEECSRNAFLDLFSRLLMSQESKYGSIRAHATFIYLTLEISKSTPWWVVLTLYETISSKSRATRPRWLSLIDHGMRCAVSAQCMLNFRDLA